MLSYIIILVTDALQYCVHFKKSKINIKSLNNIMTAWSTQRSSYSYKPVIVFKGI